MPGDYMQPGDKKIIEALLRPSSVAVIGAAREPYKIGYQVVKNLLEGGFPPDKIYPVNPFAEEILGLKCYSSVKDVEGPVDLAVIVVPAKVVPKVLQDCVEKGVKAAAIISAGFKEVGNVEAELQLVEIARKGVMRILGPNIVGVCDTVKRVNASFCQALPVPGNIAFITQSGALAIALVGWTRLRRIGLSDLVSIGNKADINEVDLMDFFGDDPHTKVITMYLEGITDGRKFIEVAREVTPKKPVIILKAGKAARAQSAIKSHTGSLAGTDAAYNAVFKQTGVLRAPTFPDLFDWATAFAKAPLPKGENVVIVTNGGGAGVMATDAAEQWNVKLMDMPEDLAKRMRYYMPPFGSVFNPIDLTGMAGKEWYKGSIKELLRDERVHAIVVLYCHTAVTKPREIGEAILEAVEETGIKKTIVASFIGGVEVMEECERLTQNGIPCYESPEKAIAALGALYEYKRRIEKLKRKTYPQLKVNTVYARSIIEKALSEGRTSLTPSEAAEVCQAYGIPVLEKPLAKSEEEVEKLAEKLGYPLVLEVESPQVVHKTEVGGIKVGIENVEEAKQAYREIIENVRSRMPSAEIRGVIVRRMAPQGREVIVGMHRDSIFGPLIMFGSGGILVELIKDVSFRVTPLSLEDVEEMIKETKAYKTLKGFRGEKEADIETVKDTILRVAKLAEDIEEISDIDINPFFVYEKGGLAVDVKILLRPKD